MKQTKRFQRNKLDIAPFLQNTCKKKQQIHVTNFKPDEIPGLVLFNHLNIFENKIMFIQPSLRLWEN